MKNKSNRAVVTGIGIVSPVGRGKDTVFEAMCAPTSGIVAPPEGHEAQGLVDGVGIAPFVDPFTVVARTDAGIADRFAIFAVAAADDAIADSGIKIGEDVDPLRVAVVVSTGAGGMETFEKHSAHRRERGANAVSPFMFAGFLPNMAGARIAIKYGIRGYSATIATACSASAHAVAEGFRLIESGDADVVVCGGTDSALGATSVGGFMNARALAKGFKEDPTRASRPFDRERNGFVLGEGGGIMVIESAELADRRGAAAYADLVGWGATTDAYHLMMPRPDGSAAAACMRNALNKAGLDPSEIGYVNAHGTGTRIGDLAESKAFLDVFGDDQPLVSSTKGATGHLLGGAGVLEAAATAMALSQQRVPPTLNLEDPDPKCDLNHIRGQAKSLQLNAALSNSFAFGGHNVSLIFQTASTTLTRAPKVA